MTELAINRDQPRDHGNGWRSTLMGWGFVAFMASVGWIATDAQTARNELTTQINAQARQIATLEESNRNIRDSLERIERMLYELQRLSQERRR